MIISMSHLILNLKKWTLPLSMFIGALSFFIVDNIDFTVHDKRLIMNIVQNLQQFLLFMMLFMSFCKIKVRQLKLQKWMLILITIQIIPFAILGILFHFYPMSDFRLIGECAMLCLICPTATAASVVTMKLGGKQSVVVTYTFIINILSAFIIPLVIPLLYESEYNINDFIISFVGILSKTIPLLLLPMLAAIILRRILPNLHSVICAHAGLAFYIWAVGLALAISVTTKALVRSEESLYNLLGIAVVSLLCCVFQFIFGRVIGGKYNNKVEGTQSLGQKNTVFIIWVAYTFMNPVLALSGGFYSIWHNLINTFQLRKYNSD